ncbi:hypothetical protein ACQSDF_16760, partial [Salmonella enterica]
MQGAVGFSRKTGAIFVLLLLGFLAYQFRDFFSVYEQVKCSGQLKLATVLEFFQYLFSDSFGD